MTKKKTELEKLETKIDGLIKYFNEKTLDTSLPVEVNCHSFYIQPALIQLKVEVLRAKQK